MSKYIDAGELKNAFTNWNEIVNNPYDLFPSVEECKSVIDAQPTADVVEVRRGRWEHDGYDFPHGNDWIHCSVCGKRGINVPANLTPYCPNCGAKMDEECENESV